MRARPDLLRSLLESGLREHRAGRLEAAREAYQQALALAPDHPHASNLLGAALLQLGQVESAVAHLQRAARALHEDAGVIGNLAQAYAALGRHEDCRSAFAKAARLDPRQVRYPLGVATSYAMEGNFAEAESRLRELTGRFPNEALIWFNLGNVMRDQQRPAEAIDTYRRAVVLDPLCVDARNNLGSVLHSLLRFEEAEHEYRACIEIAPGYLPAKLNLASLMIDVGRACEAEPLCREVVALAPGMGEAAMLLGAAVGHQGRLLEAAAWHRKVAEHSPQDAKAAAAYAEALAHAGCFSEAYRWFARALRAEPESTDARFGLAFALLAAGQLADGWVEYGYRPSRRRFRERFAEVALSRTLPADLDGKRINLVREQGLGDELFFLRYASQLSAQGARVTYHASSKLTGLLARVPEIEQVVTETAALPAADTTLLVGDLPHALSAQPASRLPNALALSADCAGRRHPYRLSIFWPPVPPSIRLHPLDTKLDIVRKRLASAGEPPYLGVTWRGGTPPREQGAESWMLYKEIAIPLLADALKRFRGTVLALQRRPVPGEIERLSDALGRPVHDATDLNEDLEEMLAALALIDEYVGVSNTNMHLRAGAGGTARVLVPGAAEWRWMNARSASPWFPGFAIYRQSLQGDWRAALAALGRDLENTWRQAGARN